MESYQDAMFELRESNRVRANPNTKVPPTGLTMTGQSLAATCLRLIGFFCPSPLARFQCQEHQHGFKKGVFLGKAGAIPFGEYLLPAMWPAECLIFCACRSQGTRPLQRGPVALVLLERHLIKYGHWSQ
jgi:hypothetical protein